MSYASKQQLRPVMAVVLAQGLALTAVGGTMAQEEPDRDTGGQGGSGGPGGNAVAISVSSDGGTLTLQIDPPGLERNTNDLRGKILRISVNEDGSYAVDAEGQRLRYEWDFDGDGD